MLNRVRNKLTSLVRVNFGLLRMSLKKIPGIE